MSCSPRCPGCPFREREVVGPSMTSGREGSAVISFIGQHPGNVEITEGRLFAGFSGQKLMGALHAAGLQDVTRTYHNALNCNPPRKATTKELTRAYKACKPRLHAELAEFRAPFVVPMGTKALRAVDLTGSVLGYKTAQRGSNTPNHTLKYAKDYKPWVFPTVHPAILHESRLPMWEAPFVVDLKRVAYAIKHGKLRWSPGRINLEPSLQDVKDFAEAIQYGQPVAFDIETAGFGHKAPLTCLGFSTGEETIVIPFSSWGDDYEHRRKVWSMDERAVLWPLIQGIFYKAKLIAQNGKYDTSNLEENGFYVADAFRYNGEDTLGQAYVLCSDYPKNLGTLASFYTDSPRWKDMVDHGDSAHDKAWELNYRKYNALDCVNTFHVWKQQDKDLDPTERKLYKQFMSMQDIAMRMMREGIRLDRDRLQAHLGPTKKKYQELKEEFRDITGGTNPNSSKQLRELFFSKLDAPVHSFTSSGQPSTGKDALKAFSEYPDETIQKVTRILLEYRKFRKIYRSFLKPFKGRERIYPLWNVAATHTGRWSCSLDDGPSLQTLPKAYRDIFIPNENHVYIGADWPQLEMRVIGYLANCKQLIHNFMTGDPHTNNALTIFGVEELADNMRDLAKIFWYAQQYEGGVNTIHAQLTSFYDKKKGEFPFRNMTRDQVRALILKVKKLFPELSTFKEWYWEDCLEKNYAYTFISGRRRHCKNGMKPTEVKNYPIQGTSGDCMNLVVLELDRLLPDALRFQIHDEAVIEVHEDDADKGFSLLKQAMEMEFTLESPFGKHTFMLPVEPNIGRRFSEIK